MNDDDLDIHEPEHDHLLDHEFFEDDDALQDEVNPLFDPHDDDDDEEDDDALWDEGVDTLDDL
ncbi:hypothetical protein [Pseudomonas rubra]|uniref:Uncharacterized protein n=1 Tax=Pseudomonas rubra TaxID=2942627 RepID=A0ABT5PFN0_9PSED|nr:hypothetical protein [Pseudomonas rubra]MDD1016803.1 hypothetical protein [Pseudomonas rubra]MDD1038664.1 hypothetical protein [Pseudomonas rubra]MDD1157171.1 hypothetical protein [Pseudomonas rubra]